MIFGGHFAGINKWREILKKKKKDIEDCKEGEGTAPIFVEWKRPALEMLATNRLSKITICLYCELYLLNMR